MVRWILTTTTGEVYVPDQKNMQLVVLNPVNAGFALPKEPARVIKLNVAPASIAITSDGQLGFAALQDGSVAMYDIPGQQGVTCIHTVPHILLLLASIRLPWVRLPSRQRRSPIW